MYQITASIVSYNNDLKEILRAVSSFLSTKLKVRLYVVDNSISDDLGGNLPEDDRIEYHFMNQNLGFGKGHNFVLDLIKEKSEFHVMLNPDVYYDEDVLESLYDYMNANKSVGIVVPTVLSSKGERADSCRLLPNPFTFLSRKLCPSFLKDPFLKGSQKEFCSPWVSGCFVFIRTDLFVEFRGFDERYFMYCEDIDLSRKVYDHGYDVVCYPYVKIHHVAYRDSSYSFKMFKLHLGSIIRYFNKWGWFYDKRRCEINERCVRLLNESSCNEEFF